MKYAIIDCTESLVIAWFNYEQHLWDFYAKLRELYPHKTFKVMSS